MEKNFVIKINTRTFDRKTEQKFSLSSFGTLKRTARFENLPFFISIKNVTRERKMREFIFMNKKKK